MVEFLQNLIFGLDYPGLTLALDPITIALLIGGITKGVQGIQQSRAGKKTRDEGRDLFDKQVQDFRSGKYDITMDPAVTAATQDMKRLGAEAAFKTGETARSAISSAVSAGRYGDPRMAAYTPQFAQTALGEAGKANQAAALNTAQVGMDYANKVQGIRTANESTRQQLESMMMARGAGMEQQGTQQRQEGINTAIGGFGDAFGAYASDPNSIFGPINRNKYVIDDNGNKAYKVRNFSLHNFIPGQMQNGYMQGYGGYPLYNPNNPNSRQDGGRVPRSTYVLGGIIRGLYDMSKRGRERAQEDIARKRAAEGKDTTLFGYKAEDFDAEGNLVSDDSGDITITVSKDGKVQTMQDGGVAPEILPGEFDHGSNPIHMIDDDGNKVAEATGGEILFNHTQSNNLIKLLQSGDSEALYAYLAELMQSPQFQMEIEEYNSELNG